MTLSSHINIEALVGQRDLFRLFNAGKHLNRVADPVMWTELEREQECYALIFNQLGYDLRIDGRGYAWFHSDESSSNTNKNTRQFALLFMVLFEYQADSGKALNRFTDWIVDAEFLRKIFEKNSDLLKAEEIDAEAITAMLGRCEHYGFALKHSGTWRLLPAVSRYLDHF